jgi:hypothetical protein
MTMVIRPYVTSVSITAPSPSWSPSFGSQFYIPPPPSQLELHLDLVIDPHGLDVSRMQRELFSATGNGDMLILTGWK